MEYLFNRFTGFNILYHFFPKKYQKSTWHWKAKELYVQILDNELQKNEMPKEIYENAKRKFLDRYEKINWSEYHESLPFNTSALSLYEWSPIAEELKSLDKKIVLNSMILKWDNVKKEFIELINI